MLPFTVRAQTPVTTCSIDSAGTARLPVAGGALADPLIAFLLQVTATSRP